MTKRRLPLLHRGYLYAQKHVEAAVTFSSRIILRWSIAKAWRAGYVTAQREAKNHTKTPPP